MLQLAATPAMKSHLEAQINFMTELSNKLCDSACRLNELNVHLGQQMVEDTLNTSRNLLQTSDPMECSSIAMAQMQPMAEHMRHYQRELLNVVAGTQAELTRTAETHIPEASRTAAAVAEEVVKRTNEETERATQRQHSMMDRMGAQAGQPGSQQAGGARPGSNGGSRPNVS